MAPQIHPTAVVDPSAELADGVVIGPQATIGPRVVLGEGTEIGANAQVQGPTVLGKENRVFPFAAVGFEPQDLKYEGEETFLEVGDRNHFREFCSIHRGTAGGGGKTVIGSENLFMVYSHVGHDCRVGSRCVFVNNATLGGHALVEDDVTIGAFSAVHQFTRVGRHAYIGGYSVITMDILPYMKLVGQKPVYLGLNSVGLRRKGMGGEARGRLRQAVRLFLDSGLNTSQALEQIEAEVGGHPEVDHLVSFIRSSQRGVLKARPGKGKRSGSRGGADPDDPAGPESDGEQADG